MVFTSFSVRRAFFNLRALNRFAFLCARSRAILRISANL
nr:MAG TPA: hypothetical protein [Caudoviricetes sp.]